MDPRQSGAQRTPVALERLTARVPVGDGYEEQWERYADLLWADVRPVVGTEQQVASIEQAPVTHLVRLDYRPDLLASDRVVLDEARQRYLYIQSAVDDEERGVRWVLRCEERTL